MVEIGGAVARDDLVNQSHLLADLGLKLHDVNQFSVPVRAVGLRSERRVRRDADSGKLVPFHVKNRGGGKLGGHEALIESACGDNLRDEGGRNHLSGLIMECVCREHFWLKSPILVNLRRKFHKIAGDRCAADALVVALCEQSVKRVAELVEHRAHLVNRE